LKRTNPINELQAGILSTEDFEESSGGEGGIASKTLMRPLAPARKSKKAPQGGLLDLAGQE
jgi:hypothetical protein